MKTASIFGLILLLGVALGTMAPSYGPAQVVPAVTVASTGGTIAAGKRHVEFILSSNFGGTIQGATVSGATLAVYDPGVPPAGMVFGDITYSIAAGTATITTW